MAAKSVILKDKEANQLLPKTRAELVIISDSGNNFTSDTVEGALSELAEMAANAGVTSVGGQDGAISIDETASSPGAVRFAMDGKKIKGAVQGLADVATSGSGADVTSGVYASGNSVSADMAAAKSAIDSLNTTVSSMSGAFAYKGSFSSLPATTNYEAGNVVAVGDKEYLLVDDNGTKSWREFGDEGSYVAKTTYNTKMTAIDNKDTAQDGRLDSLETLVGSTSVAAQVSGAIGGLDGSATIASKSGNIVTLKTGVTETDGVVSNSPGSDIALAALASTGAASDASITDNGNYFSGNTVEAALQEAGSGMSTLSTAVATLQNSGVFYTEVASVTPIS